MAMGKTGIAQVASTDAVAPDVIDALPTQRHAEPTQRHAEGSGNGHGSPLRDALELSKLSLELAQLEGGALTSDELRTRKQHEREKSLLELQKIHRDAAHEQET